MNLHPTREATAADINQIAAVCGQAWTEFNVADIRKPVEWTEERKQAVLDKLYMVVAHDGAVVRGVLLLRIRPPTVDIVGWTTPQIPVKERIGMGLSMLIGGYQPCVDAGVTRGQGEIVATQNIILDTLALVDTFKVAVYSQEAVTATVSEAERKPYTYHAETEIGPAYLAALEAALKAL